MVANQMAVSVKIGGIGIGTGAASTHHQVAMSILSSLHPPHSLFLLKALSTRRSSVRVSSSGRTHFPGLRVRASSAEASTSSGRLLIPVAFLSMFLCLSICIMYVCMCGKCMCGDIFYWLNWGFICLFCLFIWCEQLEVVFIVYAILLFSLW